MLFLQEVGLWVKSLVHNEHLYFSCLMLFVLELEPCIGGVAKHTCLGDTHIRGTLHGHLGPTHFGHHLLHEECQEEFTSTTYDKLIMK